MKRILLLAFCLFGLRPVGTGAQEPSSDATVQAAKLESEERFKRLEADVRSAMDTQEVIQKRMEEFRQRLEKLETEIRNLQEEQGRSSGNFVTRDDLRKFAEKVDEKREADKKLILESIKELGAKAPVVAGAEPTKEPSRNSSHRTAESPEEMPFVYTVQKNDRLLDVIAAYNKYFQQHGLRKITKEQVLALNPGLNPDRLITGKKIQIPVPAKDNR
jgi:hypothetical protein